MAPLQPPQEAAPPTPPPPPAPPPPGPPPAPEQPFAPPTPPPAPQAFGEAPSAPPAPPQAPPSLGEQGGGGGGLNLNTVTFEQLREHGLSVTQATRLLAHRERLGGYKTVDDLDQVAGFPQDLLEDLKSKSTV